MYAEHISNDEPVKTVIERVDRLEKTITLKGIQQTNPTIHRIETKYAMLMVNYCEI